VFYPKPMTSIAIVRRMTTRKLINTNGNGNIDKMFLLVNCSEFDSGKKIKIK
jgi:hypothetical protein